MTALPRTGSWRFGDPLRPAAASRRLKAPTVVPATMLLVAALLLAMAVAAARGAVPIPLDHVAQITLRRLGFPIAASWSPAEEAILWQLRLPRVVTAALVGAALAGSGALLQGLFRNPLADPYVLGISAGAGLAATVTMALLAAGSGAGAAAGVNLLRWAGFGPVPLAAAAGGLAAVMLVYALARRGGRVPVTRLLLAGFAVGSVCNAGSTLLIVLSERLLLNWRSLLGWLVGGVVVSGWSQVGAAGPIIVLALVTSWGLARWLDALLLGEDGAAQVGVPVEAAKVLVVLMASVLAGAAVALAGLVGFVGLLVPQAVRLVLGPGHRSLLPSATLAGAVFLVLADLLARTVLAPTELPVGVVTALIGGPAFLWLLRRETAGWQRG